MILRVLARPTGVVWPPLWTYHPVLLVLQQRHAEPLYLIKKDETFNCYGEATFLPGRTSFVSPDYIRQDHDNGKYWWLRESQIQLVEYHSSNQSASELLDVSYED